MQPNSMVKICHIWNRKYQHEFHLHSVQFSRSVVYNSLRPHGLQHASKRFSSLHRGLQAN